MHTGGSPGPPLSQRPFGSGSKAGLRDLSCALGSFVTSGSLVIVLILSASIATASSSTPRASLAVAPPSETATTSHSHQSLPRGQMRHLPTTAACWIMAHRHALGAQAATRQAPKLCTIVFPGLVAALPLREIHSPDSLLHHAARSGRIGALSGLRGGRDVPASPSWNIGSSIKRFWGLVCGQMGERGGGLAARWGIAKGSRRKMAVKSTTADGATQGGWGRDLLDRESFGVDVQCWALKVEAENSSAAMESLRSHIMRENRIKPVIKNVDDPSGITRLLLLKASPDGKAPREAEEYAAVHGLELSRHSVRVGYDALNAVAVLGSLLPQHLDVPSSFEMVGHIAHVNLKDQLLPYKGLIGQVILDKNPAIRTVVNKVGSIENEFRVFDMEVLAGDQDLIASVKQGGAIFRLDYSKVYWNSRLGTEHSRVVDMLPKDAIVWDVFAGIGPFAVPAAVRGCTVHANDLNPESHKWCKDNCERNVKRRPGVGEVKLYNLDAREFVRRMVREEEVAAAEAEARAECRDKPVHVIMNLPAMAPEFLDAFRGAFEADKWEKREMPMVHLYAFSKEQDAMEDVMSRADMALGVTADRRSVECRDVRLVAPGKQMVCCQFPLPRSIMATTDR